LNEDLGMNTHDRNSVGRRLATGLVLVLPALWLAACGGGNDRDRTSAQLRLVNASGYTALDLRVDDSARQTQVAYGDSAVYVNVDPDDASTAVTRSGSTTALQSLTPALARDNSYTLLAYGPEGALRVLLLDDNLGAPVAGRSLLRVVNGAPDAGPVDVYLTAAGDSLATAVPLQAAVAPGAALLSEVVPASWRLRVTAAGSKTDLRLDLPALNLVDRGVATLVLSAARGGALVNTLLLAQRGGVTRADAAQARVRVVAGLAAGGAVSAQVGGNTLLSSVGSPAVGLYALLPAGVQPVTLAVNGAALTAPDIDLAPGADYTLLVSGTAGAARADWISDDNRLPADSSTARLRLVHGVANVAGALSMTADFVPVADAVARGQASAYAAIAGTSTARLSVTAAGEAQLLYSAIEQRLDAGANYSVFVVGDLSAPVGILRKDR
jgi:hypothetical protein